jgi:large subunit ribosomal protein L13
MHKDQRNRIDHKVAPVEYAIDAKGRALGRVASEAAQALLGKKSVHYVRNKVLPVKVTISNASKLAITEKRIDQKTYSRYTGYPGGLKTFTMKDVVRKTGYKGLLTKTVDGMIPRNSLRKERMKRLIIVD